MFTLQPPRHIPTLPFAIRSCQQQVRSCPLCTESGSKFRALDDTSTGNCELMQLPVLKRRIPSLRVQQRDGVTDE